MYIRSIDQISEAEKELKKLGVHEYGVSLMSKKMIRRVIYLKDLDIKAANILKQEILALGGDLALPREASLLRGKKTDGILIVNLNTLAIFLAKLVLQPFGLADLASKIEKLLENYNQDRFVLKSRGKKLVLDKPVVMGILNVTPDSFSDGGKFYDVNQAVLRAKQIIKEGAKIIDIGGESTGPGSKEVSVSKEISRIFPVIEKIRFKNCFISVDTYKFEVAEKVLEVGVDMINDVTALRNGGRKMGELIAKYKVPIVLMYSKDNTPRTTRRKVQYKDIAAHIIEFLQKRIDFALSCGIKKSQIVIDPGMGAFVSLEEEYSFEILRRLSDFKSLGYPILIGPSRKSFIGGLVSDRLYESLASSVIAAINSAKIIRAHDVKETVRAIRVVNFYSG